LRRQRGQSEEIAEHDGHVTALRAILCRSFDRRNGPGRTGCIAGELADRAQNSQPVPERNTDIDEVLIGQLRQHVRFDPVRPEYGLVLVKAEAAQPGPYIHLCWSPHPAQRR